MISALLLDISCLRETARHVLPRHRLRSRCYGSLTLADLAQATCV